MLSTTWRRTYTTRWKRLASTWRPGESVHIASKRLPFFKVGKELSKMVGGGQNEGA